MKKIEYIISVIIITLFILMNTPFIGHASAAGLQVSFTTNPVIASPGTFGYIEVNLKSISGTASNIEISASSWDPNAVIPEGNWKIKLVSLESGDSYSVFYEFKVSSTAASGLYQVVFDIEYSGGSSTRQTAIIKVEDATVLDLKSIKPTSVNIGEATTLVFNITNSGKANIENILFVWTDPNDLILPVGSDNRITIPLIASENYTEISIVVMASSGISPGIYPLTITMNFYDQTGTEQTITSTVGLQISGTTTFDVVLQTSTTSSTTFAIVNTGANTASSVVVSIPQQPNYSTSGTSSASLGNLDAGDYTLASFQLSSTNSNTTMQFPLFNRTRTDGRPTDMNFSTGLDRFVNQTFLGGGSNQLLVQIAYTDVFGVRQNVEKQVDLSSGSVAGFSSRTGTQGTYGNFPGGFSDQSQSSGSSNSIMYIVTGVIGIIIIVAIIQLGRRKKLGRFSNFFKGRKE